MSGSYKMNIRGVTRTLNVKVCRDLKADHDKRFWAKVSINVRNVVTLHETGVGAGRNEAIDNASAKLKRILITIADSFRVRFR